MENMLRREPDARSHLARLSHFDSLTRRPLWDQLALDLLCHRTQEGRFENARRGEHMLIPPVGYLQGSAG
jgi:hypothetical protein